MSSNFVAYYSVILGVALILALLTRQFRPKPKTQAKFLKMTGFASYSKDHFVTMLILALEDPEVRTMIYDAIQEESKRRKGL